MNNPKVCFLCLEPVKFFFFGLFCWCEHCRAVWTDNGAIDLDAMRAKWDAQARKTEMENE